MEQVIETRARRRRMSRRVRRAPLRRFDEPFEDEERELVIGGGDDKPVSQ